VKGDVVEITAQVTLIPNQTAIETQKVLQSDFAEIKDFVARAVQTVWRKAGHQIKSSRPQNASYSQIGACPSETWSFLSSDSSNPVAQEEQMYILGKDIERSSSRLSCEFELSASFFPEQYTANSEIPKYLVAQYVYPQIWNVLHAHFILIRLGYWLILSLATPSPWQALEIHTPSGISGGETHQEDTE
jgi:hypothetical protein